MIPRILNPTFRSLPGETFGVFAFQGLFCHGAPFWVEWNCGRACTWGGDRPGEIHAASATALTQKFGRGHSSSVFVHYLLYAFKHRNIISLTGMDWKKIIWQLSHEKIAVKKIQPVKVRQNHSYSSNNAWNNICFLRERSSFLRKRHKNQEKQIE